MFKNNKNLVIKIAIKKKIKNRKKYLTKLTFVLNTSLIYFEILIFAMLGKSERVVYTLSLDRDPFVDRIALIISNRIFARCTEK